MAARAATGETGLTPAPAMRESRRLRGARRGTARGGQSGSILLVTLVALLLMFIGALFTLRGVLTDSALTDAFSQRQKDTQASTLALQALVQKIQQSCSVNGGPVLQICGSGQPWMLLSPLTAPPTPAYWSACANGSTSSATCASISLANGAPQQAWGFVQWTGRSESSNSQGITAWYYDVWIHTVDPRTHVAVDTESLYRKLTNR